MKIFLWIALAVCAILMLLCVPRMRVQVSYDMKSVAVSVKVLCFSFSVFPGNKRKRKKADGQQTHVAQKEKKDASLPAEILKIEGVTRELLEGAGRLVRAIRIDRLHLDVRVASSDAGTTAMLYGGTCAAVGLLLPLVENYFTVRQKMIAVNADFSQEQPLLLFQTELSARPMVLIAVVSGVAVRMLGKILKQKKAVQHEQSSN